MPPILFARPTHEWISRVDQKRKQLAALQLSKEQNDRIDRWTETEFVYSTLRLEGVDVSRQQVTEFVQSPSVIANATSTDDLMIVTLLESLRKVETLACGDGRTTALTPDLLVELHNAPGDTDGFRKGPGSSTRSPRPISPEHLPAAVEAACRWYTAESFAELHPVEQASIVLLRLIELQPFDQANSRTALVAASLFTLRSELPPLIVRTEMQPAYHAAIDEGSRMNTKPMVEMVAEAVEHSVREMIEEAGGPK